jgi:cell division protein FtsW (lipid II flippase)
MQHYKTWAWSLLIIVLGLESVAFWAMVWHQDLRTSLLCFTVSVGLLFASSRRWRWGREKACAANTRFSCRLTDV